MSILPGRAAMKTALIILGIVVVLIAVIAWAVHVTDLPKDDE